MKKATKIRADDKGTGQKLGQTINNKNKKYFISTHTNTTNFQYFSYNTFDATGLNIRWPDLFYI